MNLTLKTPLIVTGFLLSQLLVTPLATAEILSSTSNTGYWYPSNNDRLGNIIQQRQQQYQNNPQPAPIYPSGYTQPAPKNGRLQSTILTNNSDFNRWVASSRMHQEQVAAYQQYLQTQLGSANVPPMDQLTLSAREAVRCGYEPYEVPPQYLWANIVPTLRLLQALKQQGYLPYSTVIRSVYRNPDLNRCAGGAAGSKHQTNGAMDVWIPEYEGQMWKIKETLSNLCGFWESQGESYQFGLGLYSTGAIHIDTQGWRRWGGSHGAGSSPCS